VPGGGATTSSQRRVCYISAKPLTERLEPFESWVKQRLAAAPVVNADETGINIGGKLAWLHTLATEEFTYYYPHAKRGSDAMDEMGILPHYQGTICHDHWQPYFKYGHAHALCNAHHLRELERACEQDGQQWAQVMAGLLTEINTATTAAGGCLDEAWTEQYRQRYRDVIRDAEKECPPPEEKERTGKRGKIARSKARNLLERLRDFEEETLRFMIDPLVPFTNNQVENDLRMTKVQQKISGCFRSMEGALNSCRIRSYLSTCRKHGVTASEALRLLFQGTWPAFMNDGQTPPCAE